MVDRFGALRKRLGLTSPVRLNQYVCSRLALILLSVTAIPSCDLHGTADRSGPAAAHPVSVELEWDAGQLWEIDRQPAFELGSGRDGGPTFHKIDDVVTLKDESLLVVDRGNMELLRYTRRGGYLSTLGRMGFGPGEFRTFAGILSLDPETILVFDPALPRFTTLRLDGEVVAADRVEIPESAGFSLDNLRLTRALDANRMLLVPSGVVIWRRRVAGSFREAFPLVVYRRTGKFAGPFGPSWAIEMWGDERTSIAIPFGRRTVTASRDSLVYVADTQSGRIEAWDANGLLVREFVIANTPALLTGDIIESWLDERTRPVRDPSSRRAYRDWLKRLPFPERLPHFDDLKVDASGRLWLRSVRQPRGDDSQTWTILNPGGTPVAKIDLPKQLQLEEIHEDRILGVWTDSLGVETVRAYALLPGRDRRGGSANWRTR